MPHGSAEMHEIGLWDRVLDEKKGSMQFSAKPGEGALGFTERRVQVNCGAATQPLVTPSPAVPALSDLELGRSSLGARQV
jgi:hypothetical protein